ncbi:MAG TPA: pyridoxamine 5'-phosphate oxidase [Tenuifilaceae bacterium]|jgi:pyridoxamine 5'-phosphate oxidase|nr:pyridoxamine 5'-phosphate oxidase [Tenuifilaceae bacterium]HPX05851.1 pyridoxamine 5'-phosphate oxidase [Tenuifilaceae bacterium]HQB78950.1 pyridoxamine 5'-phosphate oxidase [Tenuifilaceae bacterium]
MRTKDISAIRKEYLITQLNEDDVQSDPLKQFEQWLNEAVESNVNEPTAMTLATSTFEGKPSARVVLLKGVSPEGFSFFTNYDSKKGKQILQNPYGALVFFWPELERQVRIEGKVAKLTDKQSDEYFKTRPEGSKIGAWASPQSQVIPNRKYLENLKSDFHEEFSKRTIKRPPNWGGYVLAPTCIEFWQGRADRLHDRIQYTLTNGVWTIERLAP